MWFIQQCVTTINPLQEILVFVCLALGAVAIILAVILLIVIITMAQNEKR